MLVRTDLFLDGTPPFTPRVEEYVDDDAAAADDDDDARRLAGERVDLFRR